MRRPAIVSMLVIVAALAAAASAPVAGAAVLAERPFLWSAPYAPGTIGCTSLESLVKGPAGSIYVTGSLDRVASGVPGGGSKLLVARVDGESGARVWAKATSGPRALGVVHSASASDGRGGVVAVGTCATRGGDGYVARYGAAGRLRWSRRFCGDVRGLDGARDVVADARGNIYVAGSVVNKTSGEDAVLLKYSPDGVLLWRFVVKSNGGADDWFADLAVGPSRRVYAVGTRAFSESYSQIVTVCLRPSGRLVWRKYIDLSGTHSLGVHVAVRAGGAAEGVYVAGLRTNGDARNPYNPRLQKYTQEGEPLWTAQGPMSVAVSSLTDVAVDRQGRPVLVGSQYDTTYGHECGLICFATAAGAEGGHYQYSNEQTGVDGRFAAGLNQVAIDAEGRYYASGWIAVDEGKTQTDAVVMTYPPLSTPAEDFDGMWRYGGPGSGGADQFTPLLVTSAGIYAAGERDALECISQGVIEKLDLRPVL